MGATRGGQALRRKMAGFPGGPVVKKLPCNAGDDLTCPGATKPVDYN